MANHPKWNGVSYVDLFAGPGVCEVRETQKRLPGSAMIAANAAKMLRRIICCELVEENANALRQRLQASPSAAVSEVLAGDCNQLVTAIPPKIVEGSLVLAFVDPPNLNIAFETVATLAKGGRVDFLILLADSIDILRNVDLYETGRSDRLDRMFPQSAKWRERWGALENRSPNNIRLLFASLYEIVLTEELGYKFFRQQCIASKNGPLYRLIFASQHERGAEFWDKVTVKDRDGQQGLFGP